MWPATTFEVVRGSIQGKPEISSQLVRANAG